MFFFILQGHFSNSVYITGSIWTINPFLFSREPILAIET